MWYNNPYLKGNILGFPPLNNFAYHFINLSLPSYVTSFTALVSPPDDYIVTGGTYASLHPYSSWWVTGYYTVSELIAVSDIELLMIELIFLAS